METLNIIIVLQGLFWALLILSSKLKTIEKASLGIIMIMLALIQFTKLIPNERCLFLLSDTLNISFAFFTLSFIVLFTLESTKSVSKQTPIKNHLFFIPFFMALINILIFILFDFSIDIDFLFISYILITLYVYISAIIKIIRYYYKKQFSRNFYENTSVLLSSLLLFFVGLIIFLTITILIILVLKNNYFDFDEVSSLWINITIALAMFIIGYISITKQFKESNIKTNKSNKKNHLKEDFNKQKLIKDAFEIDKIHLDNELTIDKLSEHLSIETIELSLILNHEMNTNFYHLVNSHRVEEVKKKLKEDDNRFFTLLAIAFDCGFSSKSTFNRVFKEFTGMSPKEYKEKFTS